MYAKKALNSWPCVLASSELELQVGYMISFVHQVHHLWTKTSHNLPPRTLMEINYNNAYQTHNLYIYIIYKVISKWIYTLISDTIQIK